MNHLIIFVKNPVLGTVKTRLAETIGDTKALIVYQELTAQTLSCADQLAAVERHLYWSQEVPEPLRERGIPGFLQAAQQGESLGQRMLHAVETTMDDQSSKVVLIGSDCPALNPDILRDAYAALDDHDVVLGPASDGGYYLIGMKEPHSTLFEDMSYSHDQVAAQTVARAEEAGLTVYQLMTLSDIDEWHELEAYMALGSSDLAVRLQQIVKADLA